MTALAVLAAWVAAAIGAAFGIGRAARVLRRTPPKEQP